MQSSSIHAGLVVFTTPKLCHRLAGIASLSWNKLSIKLIITELYLNEIRAIKSFFVALFAFVSMYTPTPYSLATPCD